MNDAPRLGRVWLRRGVGVLVAGVVCEVGLWGVAAVSPGVQRALMPEWRRASTEVSYLLVDERLGHRGNPEYPGHDVRGFNNDLALDAADLVALGDSHTHGAFMVGRDAWPALVATDAGLTAYNMGFSGWGPVESLLVLDDALALQPRIIIEAVYLGDDLNNAFWSVHRRGQRTDLASDASSGNFAYDAAMDDHNPPLGGPAIFENTAVGATTIRSWLSDHSKLYGVMRLGRDLLTPAEMVDDWARHKTWAARHATQCYAVVEGGFRTVFRTIAWNRVLNLDTPRIAEGMHIVLKALDETARRCAQRNVRFVVVLLPTKELVFDALIDDRSVYREYADLIENETRVRNRARAHLEERGIPVVDALEELRACFDRDEQPYPESVNGHPNRAGHRAIADAVLRSIREIEFALGD